MTEPHISDATRADASSDSDRKIRVRSVWTSVRHASPEGSTERSEEIDCVATIGYAAALARERERLLVARRVVLPDGGERLVFVADEHGGPEVAVGPARGLGGASEQGLHPGVLEEHADRAGERGVRSGGHVEREDPSVFDQFGERRQPSAESGQGVGGRVTVGFLPRARVFLTSDGRSGGRRRAEYAGDLRARRRARGRR